MGPSFRRSRHDWQLFPDATPDALTIVPMHGSTGTRQLPAACIMAYHGGQRRRDMTLNETHRERPMSIRRFVEEDGMPMASAFEHTDRYPVDIVNAG